MATEHEAEATRTLSSVQNLLLKAVFCRLDDIGCTGATFEGKFGTLNEEDMA